MEQSDLSDLVEQWDLSPTGIICTVCGTAFIPTDKDTSPCSHLRELAEECSSWFKEDED